MLASCKYNHTSLSVGVLAESCSANAAGAAASLVSSTTAGVCGKLGTSAAWTKTAMIAGGALAGGVSSTIVGGNFWEGVCNGLICAGLNHAMHLVVEGDGKLIKATLKNIERMKAIQQKGRISSPLNSANYEKMCKYADLEMVEKYLLGDKGRDQIRLSQDHPASDQSQFQFYEGCAKGRGYQVYELDFAVSQIAGALEQGCPIILWEWDVQGSKPINAHSLVVIGVEGVEGANFQMTVIDSEARKDNLIQIRNFNELRCNHSMVQFVK